MEIAKITSPHHHITIKARHWDSMRSVSTIAHFIISLLSIAVRDIVVFIFTIIWFIWASTAQQQHTIFCIVANWHITKIGPLIGSITKIDSDWV
jgi:hypothetical protein